MQRQIEGSLPVQREKFLLELVLGGISSIDALETSMRLKINLITRCYLVAFLKVDFSPDPSTLPDFQKYQEIDSLITTLVDRSSDVLVFRKGLEETVLIMKGDQGESLEKECDLLVTAIQQEGMEKLNTPLLVGRSKPCERISDLPRAFNQAYQQVKEGAADSSPAAARAKLSLQPVELLKIDPDALEKFLKQGMQPDIPAFCQKYLEPIKDQSPSQRLLLEYIAIDMLVTAANFVHGLGGEIETVIPEMSQSGQSIANMHTVDDLMSMALDVLHRTFQFRDQLARNPHTAILSQAYAYIDSHLGQPELSLSEIAAQVGLSPSHFSVIFRREAGETFIEYLTRKRIEKAKELMRTTSMRTLEIAERVGYDYPHYFSTVFKKITGMSSTEFRTQV